MDSQQQSEYRAHVRGAATYILLGHKNPLMDAQELVRLYAVDLATALTDIDAVVESERHKAGGVFETVPAGVTSQQRLGTTASV